MAGIGEPSSLSQFTDMARVCSALALRFEGMRADQVAWGLRLREQWAAERGAWAENARLVDLLVEPEEESAASAAAAASAATGQFASPLRDWLHSALASCEPLPALVGLGIMEAALGGAKRFVSARAAQLKRSLGPTESWPAPLQIYMAEGLEAVEAAFVFCGIAHQLLCQQRAAGTLESMLSTADLLLASYANYGHDLSAAYSRRHACVTALVEQGVQPMASSDLPMEGFLMKDYVADSVKDGCIG